MINSDNLVQSLRFQDWASQLPHIRQELQTMKSAKLSGNFSKADAIRKHLLSLDMGMRITQERSGKISLWHFPEPKFEKQFHYCNYGEFIANSEEL